MWLPLVLWPPPASRALGCGVGVREESELAHFLAPLLLDRRPPEQGRGIFTRAFQWHCARSERERGMP